MQVRLLGPVDVVDGDAAQPISGLRRRAVLAVLGLTAGDTVSIERLVEVVWDGAPPARALNTLQSNISYLRGLLGGRDAIVARPPGYRLHTSGGTDLDLANRLIGHARRSDNPAERVRLLESALLLWRGRPLADVAGLSWLDSQADRLAQLRLDALHDLHGARLALGEHAQLIAELENLIREHPYQERFHRHLMLAYYRAGRQVDALSAYQQLRRRLADELDTEPAVELRELESAILRQSDTLDLAGPAEPPQGSDAAEGAIEEVPRQLPADLAGFVGRGDHLAELDRQLETAHGGVTIRVIFGTAGVGKTALAVHWAHRVAHRFPDGQLYVNLRGFDPAGTPMAPAEAIRGFLEAFGVPAARIPNGLDARAALYRTMVAGRRLLILLDNAADADQLRPLLPGASSCLVVVTSRDQLRALYVTDGAQPHPLDLMTRDEAREMLRRRVGATRLAADPAAVDDIIDGSHRLPLALAVVAARAATYPRLPLAALAAELRDVRGALQALAGGEAVVDVRAALSWSYRQLSPDAARLFRLLGLHPGPDLTAAAAASLVAMPPSRTPALLAELIRTNLVGQPVPGRYAFHGLLRTYAWELTEHTETARQRRRAVARLLDHYAHTADAANRLLVAAPEGPTTEGATPGPVEPGVTPEPLSDEAHALAWFLAERRVLSAAVVLAARHDLMGPAARRLASALAGFSEQGHWYAEWVRDPIALAS